MEIISLKCNSCGSDLQVNESTRFFNCSFCGSSLGLKKSGNAVYTEVLNDIKGNTEAILDTSEKLLMEKKVDRLDRDWQEETKQYEDVKDTEVNYGGLIISGIVGLFMLVAFIGMNAQQTKMANKMAKSPFSHMVKQPSGGSDILPVAGFFIFIILMVIAVIAISDISDRKGRKKKYLELELDYQNKRQALLNKIEEID